MYAVIETGGKQYRVAVGDVVNVEKLGLNEGETVTFDKVIAVSDDNGFTCGTPYVDGATVGASVVKNDRAKKIIVFKYKPKKGYRKKQGHLQYFTKVKIDSINK